MKKIKLKNKQYSIFTMENDSELMETITELKAEYGSEIEYVQPDYLIGSFSKTEGIENNEITLFEENSSKIDDIRVIDNNNSEEVIVAVIDTAIDYTHEALADSVYINSQEIEDGIDNDGNGY